MATVYDDTIEYDEEKNLRNIAMRALPFSVAKHVLADPNMVTRVDDRKDYGETRYISYGRVDEMRLRLCWTYRGDYIRVISLFTVHKKEWEAHYGKDS